MKRTKLLLAALLPMAMAAQVEVNYEAGLTANAGDNELAPHYIMANRGGVVTQQFSTLQKRLAREVTIMAHSLEDYEMAVEASKILFSNQAKDILHKIDEQTLLAVFEGVPQFEVSREVIEQGTPLISLMVENAPIFPSKGEMRKLTQGGGVSINKEKLADPNTPASTDMLLNGKYILAQRGKKNYYLIIVK